MKAAAPKLKGKKKSKVGVAVGKRMASSFPNGRTAAFETEVLENHRIRRKQAR